MKSLLRFAFWATVMFALAWAIAAPWQHAIAAIAGRIAVGPGREVEWEDLELFFPYDLGVFVALCFASAWVGWKARLRATGLGLLALVAVEILTLVVAMRILLATAQQPPESAADAARLVDGVIRLTGLAAGAATWCLLLGWQRLPAFARALEQRTQHTQRTPGGKR
jgi:hypothetical protein